jgi:cobalt-zinc-cadmium resistance protein CzcA
MLDSIIRFSVRNKLIIGILTLGWIIWGIFEVSQLPIDALPDITSNQVQVITISPTLASPEVERLITFPIEQTCFNIHGIKEVRSISRFGLSVVSLVFDDKTDVYWARQQVSERMIKVKDQIPREAGLPELAPVTTGLGEIYQYVLRPAKGYEGKYSTEDLRTIQDWIVRRQLVGTPGVADISSFGGKLKQYEVAIKTDRLKAMGISVQELFQAIEQNNQNSGGAYIEKGPSMLFIRTEGLTGSLEDIGNICIKKTASDVPIYVHDVANVQIGHAVRYGAMTFSDKGEVAGAVVLMLKGENASQVVKLVKERIAKIKTTLPEGIILETFYDRTKMVNRAIGTVKKNLLEGALIVVFVLVFFLSNFRASLVVASVIPLAMLFAVGMMNIFKVSGNLMSLGALDFGLIVDGAVIIVEALMHQLYHQKLYKGTLSKDEMDNAVIASSSKMMNAAVFGQVIILIVYLPILTLTGIEGKMFRPMAQTVSFALIGAFILSLTYVPMITSLVLSKKIDTKESISDKLLLKLQEFYARFLSRVMYFPKLTVGIAAALLALSIWVANGLGGEFIPKLEEGDFAVDARLLTGTSLTTSVATALQSAAILKQFPEVEKIVSRIGSSEIPTDPMPVEMSDIIVSLKPKEEWTTAATYDDLADTMSKALNIIPGLTAGFQYPVQMRFNELISGARQDVVCKVFGENLDTLAKYAVKLGAVIQKIPGAADLYVETLTGQPQIVVRYNRPLLSMYQLNVSEINRVVRTAFAGESAGLVYENERRFDVTVRLADQSRQDINDVKQLQLTTPSGLQIPLSQVASITLEEGPSQIQREDAKRRIIVGFNTRGRDVETIVAELQQKVTTSIKLPPGYYIYYGGQFENLVEAKQRLSIALPAALALIFLMLYLAFGSLTYGLLIFSAIPLSAIGGIISLWMRSMPFSISAGVGFIALFGVAVLNGIVLITEFNRLKKEGTKDTKTIILEGTKLRLRPVLMTAAVASLGFLPMALSNGAGAEVQRPLATVVIGGLITATLLTLLVLPILYYWVEQRKPKMPTIIPTVLLMFASFASFAQPKGQHIALDSMISMALQHNKSLQSSKKTTEYWDALQQAKYTMPKTQFGLEYGNINSFNNDTRLYVNQDIPLPAVYNKQKSLYAAQGQVSTSMVKLNALELKKAVRINYFSMVNVILHWRLSAKMQDIYNRMAEAAVLRYKTGDITQVEKISITNQSAQYKVQQEQYLFELEAFQAKNQQILGVSDAFIPTQTEWNTVDKLVVDSSTTIHPQIEYWEKQQLVYKAMASVEKSTLLPDVTVGFNNLSIIGWQSPDGINQKFYNSSNRFHTYHLGVSIPLWRSAVNAKIKAETVNEQIAELNGKQTQEALHAAFENTLALFKKNNAAIHYYETEGLKQADLIEAQTATAYRSGNINYAEFAALMAQALQIQLNYLDVKHQLNLLQIELEYLKGN